MIGDYFTDGVTLFELTSQRTVQGKPPGAMSVASVTRYYEMRNCKTDYLFEMDEAAFKKLKPVTPLPDDHEPTISKFREALEQWSK